MAQPGPATDTKPPHGRIAARPPLSCRVRRGGRTPDAGTPPPRRFPEVPCPQVRSLSPSPALRARTREQREVSIGERRADITTRRSGAVSGQGLTKRCARAVERGVAGPVERLVERVVADRLRSRPAAAPRRRRRRPGRALTPRLRSRTSPERTRRLERTPSRWSGAEAPQEPVRLARGLGFGGGLRRLLRLPPLPGGLLLRGLACGLRLDRGLFAVAAQRGVAVGRLAPTAFLGLGPPLVGEL